MEKYKFIEELKKMLFEDMNADGDVSPNILKTKGIYKKISNAFRECNKSSKKYCRLDRNIFHALQASCTTY